MRVVVLLNENAGSQVASNDAVREALHAAGVEATLRIVPGDRLEVAAREAAASGVDAVVVGGGDGTVSAAAGALAGGDVPLGVLPLGTLNHFAKDNGIPLDLPGAAATIAAGHVARLDVGRVNGRVFVNNSSLGVYARALVNRDMRREVRGMRKWPAMVLAALKVFRRSPLVRVRLATNEEAFVRKSPLVFVGNNCYQLDLFRVGTRSCLTAGVLSLYIATTTSRWGMLKLGVRAALGRLEQSRDFETRSVTGVEIASRRARVTVAIDGEFTSLATPLDYQAWPGALPVLTPPEAAAAPPSPGAAEGV